jgi:hypothetical protein
MRPFNALSLGIGLVLACFEITTVRAELRIDETFDKSEPWIIGYNSSLKGCVASAMSDDRTTVWIGFDGTDSDIPAYLAFTNPNWHSIEPRKFYELDVLRMRSMDELLNSMGNAARGGLSPGIKLAKLL